MLPPQVGDGDLLDGKLERVQALAVPLKVEDDPHKLRQYLKREASHLVLGSTLS